jgi:protein-tyrosine phosphatase
MLEGAYNFRDIGGGNFRRGLVYRSGQLNRLTDADRCTLNWLGIRTVFDLRDSGDLSREGEDQVGKGIQVIHAPTSMIEGDFWAFVTERGDQFRFADCYVAALAPRAAYHANLFQQILDHIDHPLVIHCSAGKDRTGIVIALLMRLAGVPDADIVTNYAESQMRLVEIFEHQKRSLCDMGIRSLLVDRVFGCDAENITDMFAHLDSVFGSVEQYLVQGGMPMGDVERLRSALVE